MKRTHRLGLMCAFVATALAWGCTSVGSGSVSVAEPPTSTQPAAADTPASDPTGTATPDPSTPAPPSNGSATAEPEEADRFPEAMFDPPVVDAAMDRQVRSIIDVPPFHQAHWGIVARDMHDGRLLYDFNGHRTFVPASNAKVLVAAAALSELGPDYRYTTALWATGPIRQGTLEGALVVDGRGDPTLSDRFHESWRDALGELADLVVRSGVRRVTGPLVIDASRWDSTSVEGSWMTEDLGWPWGATGGAFVVGEGEITATVFGGSAPGEPAAVEWDPDLGSDRLASDVVTWALDSIQLRPDYRGGQNQVVLGGSIGVNVQRRESLAVRDPVRVAGELLLDALQFRGVRVDGGVQFRWEPGEPIGECSSGSVPDCSTASRVARLQSPPLSTIVAELLGPSQNWITEQVVRTLGAELGERGSWPEGLRIVHEALEGEYAVLSSDVELHDGSGLSAYNLVTPRAMTDVLFRARVLPFGEAFRDAMASPGERGSTLSRRLRALEGRVFAKTGTLTHVHSLSGYLVRDNGRELVFSILTNGASVESRDMREAIDRLVLEMSRW